MIAVIYRAWVRPGQEERYGQLWRLIADYFVSNRGALGSTLHRSEEGYFVIYSRWPDKHVWQDAWLEEGEEMPADIPPEIASAIVSIRGCIDESEDAFESIVTHVIADKL